MTVPSHTTTCRAHAIGCAVENLRAAAPFSEDPVTVGDGYLVDGTASCICGDRATAEVRAVQVLAGLDALDAVGTPPRETELDLYLTIPVEFHLPRAAEAREALVTAARELDDDDVSSLAEAVVLLLHSAPATLFEALDGWSHAEAWDKLPTDEELRNAAAM